MRKLILSTTAIVMLSSSAALALDNLETETIVAEFSTAQRIEISRGLFRTRVEVVIDGKVIEIVYDNATFAEVNRVEEPLSQDDVDELEDEGIEIEIENDLDDDNHDDGDDD
ncbi:MAG: hypothetical protein P8L32_06840, partial [Paracoccaceae bacterium]|nr:hypothetical protein [Paracoccaceae bacterium]